MSDQQNRGGRPALPADQQRKQWDVRLTPAEQALIEQAAWQAGLPARVWARQALVKAAKAQPPERG